MYEPQVNDYVKWITELGQVHEGWVYFKADSTEEKKADTLLRSSSSSSKAQLGSNRSSTNVDHHEPRVPRVPWAQPA